MSHINKNVTQARIKAITVHAHLHEMSPNQLVNHYRALVKQRGISKAEKMALQATLSYLRLCYRTMLKANKAA